MGLYTDSVLLPFGRTACGGPYKPLFFITKQHIEGGKAAIDAGNILLEVDLIFVTESLMAIDLLFQHPQAVARHDDLVKEDVDGHFLRFDGFVSGLQHHRAAPPLVAQGYDLRKAAPEPEYL